MKKLFNLTQKISCHAVECKNYDRCDKQTSEGINLTQRLEKKVLQTCVSTMINENFSNKHHQNTQN